jgi:hypothetical protein
MNKQELRNKISSATLKQVTINIPEWDTDVIIKELNGKSFVELSDKCAVNGVIDNKRFINMAIIESVYSIDNEQIFSSEDIELVESMSADIYSKLIAPIFKLNNITGTGVQASSKN